MDVNKAIEFINLHKTILKAEGFSRTDIVHLVSQLAHESGLKPIEENLNYSAEGLVKTFPKYFPNIKFAKPYHRKPQLIANRVYSNRMGNNNVNDGWTYRGRGYIQLTGRNNYIAFHNWLYQNKYLDIADPVENPEILLNPDIALLSAIWYWKDRKISAAILGRTETKSVEIVTKLINGGKIGLKERMENFINLNSALPYQ